MTTDFLSLQDEESRRLLAACNADAVGRKERFKTAKTANKTFHGVGPNRGAAFLLAISYGAERCGFCFLRTLRCGSVRFCQGKNRTCKKMVIINKTMTPYFRDVACIHRLLVGYDGRAYENLH